MRHTVLHLHGKLKRYSTEHMNTKSICQGILFTIVFESRWVGWGTSFKTTILIFVLVGDGDSVAMNNNIGESGIFEKRP